MECDYMSTKSLNLGSRPMTAYPGESPPVSGDAAHPAPFSRDYSVYGTYPRKTWQVPYLIPGGMQSKSSDSYPAANQTRASTLDRKTARGEQNGGPIRGILRNKYDYTPITAVAHMLEESLDMNDAADSENDVTATSNDAKLRRRQNLCRFCVENYLRPMMAEFLAILFCTFVVVMAEAALRNTDSEKIVQIGSVAMLEGFCFSTFLLTFKNVQIHLNPAITLGSLFAGGMKPVLCLIYWVVQITASTTAVFLYQIVTVDGPPTIPKLPDSKSENWLTGMYRVVLSQTITSAALVLVYLINFSDGAHIQTAPGVRRGNNSGAVFAVMSATVITAFVSLLGSTASWNPMRSLGVSLAATFHGIEVTSWNYHYIFWLGPTIGSLFASFLYRLIFADDDRRLSSCMQKNDTAE